MEIAHRAIMLKLLKTLNEAQARWYVAKETLALGRGGLKAMHELTGMSRPTILKGIRDLRQKRLLGESGRLRRPGGGRKTLEASAPALARALEKIMEETTAGDPMSPLRWTSKSTYRIAEELTERGQAVSQRTVHRKLTDWGYSLQGNAKNKEGHAPANRDAQFRAIKARIRNFLRQGNPVLSVTPRRKSGGVILRIRGERGVRQGNRARSTRMISRAWRWGRPFPTAPTMFGGIKVS